MKTKEREELLSMVIEKAWEDATFKQELISNPTEAIEKLTGVKMNIPKDKTIVVRDQTDSSTVYINIPQKHTSDDVELNEEQLELVSGGVGYLPSLGDHPLPIIDCFPYPNPIKDGIIYKK